MYINKEMYISLTQLMAFTDLQWWLHSIGVKAKGSIFQLKKMPQPRPLIN